MLAPRGAVRQLMGKWVRSQGWVWVLVWPTTFFVTLGASLPLRPYRSGEWRSPYRKRLHTPARKDECKFGPVS